jgi:luciferase family oxidoreductase group 1
MSILAGVPLSVLDTSPIMSGASAREALQNTVDLARLADDLGFHRYWVPEHHSMRGVASAAPAVVVGQLAAATRRIRVGSGGVLLPNHAPLIIAEQFGTLEAYYPGRVDLGLGRASGGTKRTALMLRSKDDREAYPFEQQLPELLGYFTPGEGGTDQPKAIPAVGNVPEFWILGSSEWSAGLAGRLGLPYAFAHHLNPSKAQSSVALYRESFRSGIVETPRVLVSVSVVAADSDERAQWLAGSERLKVLGRVPEGSLRKRILMPPPEEAAAYPYTAADRAAIDARTAHTVVGGPESVTKQLQTILDDTAADELMLRSLIFDHAERRHCYELIAASWA